MSEQNNKEKMQIYIEQTTCKNIDDNRGTQTRSSFINECLSNYFDETFKAECLTGTIIKVPPQMINALKNNGVDVDTFMHDAINHEFRAINRR